MVNSQEMQEQELLKRFEDTLNEAYESSLTSPMGLSGRKLRILAQVGKMLRDCGDNEATLDLMYEREIIPLGQLPAPMDIYLEDYEEKMTILTFIANTSFVHVRGRPAKRVERRLISRLMWAAIWLTPVEKMRQWRATIVDDEPLDFHGMLFQIKGTLPRLVKYWKAKETGNIKNRPSRQDHPKKIALQRDNGRCVLLESQDPEVAHIYPHASIGNAGICSAVTEALASLWGHELIEEFMDQMGVDHVDVPQNMITLSCQIHFWMHHFKVALEPVEELSDDRKLAVRFRRLQDSSLCPKKGKKSQFDDGGLALNQDPKAFLENMQASTGHLLAFEARNARTGEPIRDGHLFYIATDDPVLRPLPSIRIMQVCYRMALIIRLAGSAEDDDDDTLPDPPDDASTASRFSLGGTLEFDDELRSISRTGETD